ncbi:MAG: spermidine/putrescine ABC transporter permease PotB, partial [Treponema sp.]|nr:spermidine/putrescine ABC transporter permease PotB [Treponema sp.]
MKKSRLPGSAAMVFPLYLFALVLVLFPLLYMVVLSFLRRSGTYGITFDFTLRNYLRIGEKVYLETFIQSL